MATVALGTKEVGSIVKLNIDGTPWEFIVVHKGKPGDMYDDSCDGVWLLMKDCYENRRWNSSNVNDYANSTIHAYLNNEFLELFDANIQPQIKQVKIPYQLGDGASGSVSSGSDGLSTRIFLLSVREVGLTESDSNRLCDDGEKLDFFIKGGNNSGDSGCQQRIAYLNGSAVTWALRSPDTGGNSFIWQVTPNGVSTVGRSSPNEYCMRPALILTYNFSVSDDGVVSPNTSPTMPVSINIPKNIQGGTNLEVVWSASTDPDGNLAGYELERQVDGGEWVQIYKGTDTSYTDAITRGWETVVYRVRAYDAIDYTSDYTVSPTREVNNNRAPAITCTPASGADLGVKGEGFTVSYSASDADGDPVTVTAAIDGVTLRTFTPEAEESCAFALTGETFMKLLNGTHELTITASDGQAQAVHKLTFTKSVTAASITLADPMEADGPITLCILSVTGSIPEDADYSVQVTNNALDGAPVWENCTDEVKLGANHVFTNDTAANGFAFNFLVSVERGESGQGGYINSVQGGFQ